MQSYDISHVPPAVHDAVLHLMDTLVQAFPTPAEEPTDPTPIPAPPAPPQRRQRSPSLHAVPALPGVEPLPTPTPVRCPHGTRETPCCAACTTFHRAEAVLVDVQTDVPQRFPRSAVELWVLEALQALYPMPATPVQLAAFLKLPRDAVQSMLYALGTLGTLDRQGKGYYRHRPTP